MIFVIWFIFEVTLPLKIHYDMFIIYEKSFGMRNKLKNIVLIDFNINSDLNKSILPFLSIRNLFILK